MNIQELKDFFAASNFSEETKATIAGILADKTEATPGLIFQIKDILQKELDTDIKELDLDEASDPETQKIEKEYVEALDKIESDLGKDMEFVEKGMNDLEDLRKQVVKVEEEMEIEKIRQSI